MNSAPFVPERPSLLSLGFEVVEDNPDWPDLKIRVDGKDPFTEGDEGWRGFDPDEVLGNDSPLIPEDSGRRVAVGRCSCGVAGCGSLAPLIVASADGRWISWIDFRDYTGVFGSPVAAGVTAEKGSPKSFPDLHFEREQYLAEVDRARRDRSWETPRRQVARLVAEKLRPLALVLPPNLTFRWVSPAWSDEGVVVSFERDFSESDEREIHQRMLHLTATATEPAHAAEELSRTMLAVPPEQWWEVFGHRVC